MLSKNSNPFARAGILVFGVILLTSIPLAKIMTFAFRPYQANSQDSVILEISKGTAPHEITKTLVSKGMISNGKSFFWLGRLTRQWSHIKAGEYQFSPSMNPMQIFATLTSGVSVAYPVTIKEGENLYEIAQSLVEKTLIPNAQEFVKICTDPQFIASFPRLQGLKLKSLEGFLFPDTYYFNHSIKAPDMAKQMVHHFFDLWKEEQVRQAGTQGLSLLQAVTLASMIEKETGAPEERPLISSVFYNRLNKKMRLQSDPTTIYGIWNRYRGNLLRADLLDKNEYNTYQIPALPIGPIANPGKESLHAALNPAKSNFLYFVSHNDGTHEFTATYQDHLAAVRRFQLDPKAREGKSWRDLAHRPAK